MRDSLLPLIDMIYSAAVAPESWPTVASEVQRLIGGHSVNFAIEDTEEPKFDFFFTNGTNDKGVEVYQEKYLTGDQLNAVFDCYQPGKAILSQDIWSERELHSLFPYEDFYKKIGYTYFNSLLFFRSHQHRGWISVVRSEKDKPFGSQDLELMQTLSPHLSRSFYLHNKLRISNEVQKASLESLDNLKSAFILLKQNGKINHCNERGSRYISNKKSSPSQTAIHLPDHEANRKLNHFITSIKFHNPATHRTMIPFFDHGKPKTLSCFPWQPQMQHRDLLGHDTAYIIIIHGDSSLPDKDALSRKFGFSCAEARVATEILKGRLAAEVSEELCISEATVRYHIRSLLYKTESRNQVEMVLKIIRQTSLSYW